MGGTRKAKIGKSRLPSFPEATLFPWSYAEFAERYGKDVIERKAAPLILATPDQISEMKRLLDVVKLPEDWQEKTFKKAEIEAWEEIDADKMDAIIKMLKGRLP
jgi:hypothetical protein